MEQVWFREVRGLSLYGGAETRWDLYTLVSRLCLHHVCGPLTLTHSELQLLSQNKTRLSEAGFPRTRSWDKIQGLMVHWAMFFQKNLSTGWGGRKSWAKMWAQVNLVFDPQVSLEHKPNLHTMVFPSSSLWASLLHPSSWSAIGWSWWPTSEKGDCPKSGAARSLTANTAGLL